MSAASHGRRLRRLGQAGESKRWSWIDEVYEVEREYQAARGMIAFVLALAGTDKMPPQGVSEMLPPSEPSPPPRRAAPISAPRPDRNAILTWDEAMKLGWHDGTPVVETPPPTEEERRDPWHGWNLPRPPSYAQAADDREDASGGEP